jgi:hypothetical protein
MALIDWLDFENFVIYAAELMWRPSQLAECEDRFFASRWRGFAHPVSTSSSLPRRRQKRAAENIF